MHYNIAADTRSVYVHWPFCPYRCHYCPFVALAGQDEFMERYHYALITEMRNFGKHAGQIYTLDTLFLGGGTPSTYPDNLLLDMFGILKTIYHFHAHTEVTIEVNPGTVRPEQLAIWQSAGINRISVGVQSLKDGVLHELNRLQKMDDVYTLLAMAPSYIENISIDLILGLPGVTPHEWQSYLREVVTWPIRHISIYFLTIHEDTPLYFKVQKNKVTLPSDENMVSMYYWTCDYLMDHGFLQYELSNFAKEGFHSRHNSVYWDRKPYKAFGLGACSFDGSNRIQNEKNLTKYIAVTETGFDPAMFVETLTSQQVYLEKIMLNLRLAKGVLWQDLETHLMPEQKVKLRQSVALLKEKKFLIDDGNKIRLTMEGLVVENQIIGQLLF